MKKDYWFTERVIPGTSSGNRIQVRIKRKVKSFKTPFQKGEILDTRNDGRMLVLDGIVQLSEKDEFIYHEMMAHVPLFCHPNPQKVLIIGGGDGGVLREVLKHPVKEAYLVEIDEKVIEISKKYLPFVSKGAFKDKRAKILIEDGIKFIRKYHNFFNVVIIDSTDPEGLSLSLFREKFYRDVSRAMTKEGIIFIQSGTFWDQFKQVKNIFKTLKKVFPIVKLYRAGIPSYQDIEYSFTLGSKKINVEKINFKRVKQRFKKIDLKTKYYSPDMHLASGILPKIFQIK